MRQEIGRETDQLPSFLRDNNRQNLNDPYATSPSCGPKAGLKKPAGRFKSSHPDQQEGGRRLDEDACRLCLYIRESVNANRVFSTPLDDRNKPHVCHRKDYIDCLCTLPRNLFPSKNLIYTGSMNRNERAAV
jgi:hypothetical protein